MRRTLFAAALFFLIAGAPPSASAQAISELVMSDQPVPETYESWSLFLICNPQWLVPESQSNLLDLYTRFQAFGRALGPDHVAVWFWSRPWSWDEPGELHSAVDVIRSSAFCSVLDLPLSESPYVVVTTEYPGTATLSGYPDSFSKPENFYVLRLDKVDAAEATALLAKLADAVVAEKIFELDPESEGFWRTWENVFERVREGVVDVTGRIRVTINTQFFKIELFGE